MSGDQRNGRTERGFDGVEHPRPEQLDQYRSHSLPPDEFVSIDRHLKGCANCRQLALARVPAGSIRLPEEVLAIKEPLHLSYEEISSYVDGSLAGGQKDRVEAHAFLCESCGREIADLKRLDQQWAAEIPEKLAEPEGVSIFQRIASFFATPWRVREFGLALGAIVAGTLVIFQADRSSRAPAPASGEAAKLMYIGASGHSGFALGGLLLIVAGLVFLGYSMRKKK